jgi:hypothetical protein
MNDTHDPALGADARRKELISLFLGRTVDEVEQMRRNVPLLISGDDAAWRHLRFCAQRIRGTAHGLELGVLSSCARELEGLADERFKRTGMDAHFLLSVTSAIEMVAIELNEIRRFEGS